MLLFYRSPPNTRLLGPRVKTRFAAPRVVAAGTSDTSVLTTVRDNTYNNILARYCYPVAGYRYTRGECSKAPAGMVRFNDRLSADTSRRSRARRPISPPARPQLRRQQPCPIGRCARRKIPRRRLRALGREGTPRAKRHCRGERGRLVRTSVYCEHTNVCDARGRLLHAGFARA